VTDRDPEPGLESIMAAGMRGDATVDEVMTVFRDWPLIVPSGADFSRDASLFQPVVYDREGTPMMALFTSPDRLRTLAELAPYWTTLAGSAVLSGAQPGTGFVVNPGSRLGLELDPDAVAHFAGTASEPHERSFGRAPTVLESVILDVAARRATRDGVLAVLAESDITVPSAAPLDPSAEREATLDALRPPIVESHGIRHIAVFSHADLIRDEAILEAVTRIELPATAFARAILGNLGLIVDPGTAFEFALAPHEVALLAAR
jgi:hypothetical protein